ncbi:MAG TPA: SDR family NAD(P)-dependent oxidoreductase, partial [Flavisolibacter sp.]
MTGQETLLQQRVHTSQLLGKNKSLVLHGGGNTSVKITEKNLLGEEEDILYVKGSGWDLETITEAGFSPVRAAHLRKLAELPDLPDSQMVNEMVTHLTRASAPVPSVEAILHAVIPYRFVDHTHADAVVAISNSVDGDRILRELYGDEVIYIPYIMPGFDLSRLCAARLKEELTPDKKGIILLHHGIFTFGDTADISYDRMISLVKRAEDYIKANAKVPQPTLPPLPENDVHALAALRRDISNAAGFPVVLQQVLDQKTFLFCNRPGVAAISQQGPATPDHVIRTKRLPMVGRNVEQYVSGYRKYFEENEPAARDRKQILDPAPRVILDPVLGMCTAGKTAKDAAIVADIYDHTIDIIQWAEALGGYRALPAKDIFDVEYWELEQAKLKKTGSLPLFTGEVALVTGAASGIGKACAEALLKNGAAVIGLDIQDSVESLFDRPDYKGIRCDLARSSELAAVIEDAAGKFGGIDMLVLNAGIFPKSSRIESLDAAEWQRVMSVNLDANML